MSKRSLETPPSPEDGARGDGADVSVRPADEQAGSFQITRDARRNELNEDYAELIADLIEQKGEARPVDIAERLGVTQPTVTKALTRLQREGLVVREPYRAVFLSEKGQALAEECRQRHRIVVALLIALGVDEATAEQDAEGIEHHVSDVTLAAFSRFIARDQE